MTTQLPFNLEDLQFDLDLNNIEFEIDAIQNEILQFYIQTDLRFRRAFYTNFTTQFFQLLRDKARLKQPVTFSCTGQTRSGKSTSMITVGIIHSALYGKLFTADYICGNSMEYLEKLRDLPEEMTRNSFFIVDEEKQNMMGIGSFSKKLKLTDVQNITAVYNVSSVMICPNKISAPDSLYSLRCFGKGIFKDKPTLPDGSPNYAGVCRFLLYNLQGGDRVNGHPLGMVYIPQYTKLFPEFYTTKLTSDYMAKKTEWVNSELKGQDDVLAEMRLKIARNFAKDEKCMGLKKRERASYCSVKLGSGYTSTEILDIVNLTCLIEKGLLDEEE